MAESNATQVILTDDGLKIIKAQNTADNAFSGIGKINDPNQLGPAEKQTLRRKYQTDKLAYDMDIKTLTDTGLPVTELQNAMNALDNFITPYFKDMGKTEQIDRDQLNQVFNDFDTADKNANNAFNNMVQQAANDAKEAGNKAQEAGEEAKTSANQAQADATQAKADAATAQQTLNNIHLDVKNADGSTATFNMNSNTILLDANKIILSGNTSIQDGTIGTAKIANAAINTAQIADSAINNAKIANLDAGKITTGIMDASHIDVDQLIANGINGKTITGITINTPNLQLGTNGTLNEDWALNQDTSLFSPKRGSGTMTLTQGILATSGTLSRWWSNDGGYWYGIGDDGSKIKDGSNQVGDNYGAGYAQHNIFDSNGNTLLRTYMDATGVYMNSGGTSSINTVLTQQGLTTTNIDALGTITGDSIQTQHWIDAGLSNGHGIRIGQQTVQSHNSQNIYFNGDDDKQSVTIHAKAIIQSSQLSRKKDIKPLDPDYAMKVIRDSDMYGYRYKEDAPTEPLHYSGIIDDVNGTPQFRMPNEFISDDRTGRNDGNTVAFLVEALKQADKRIGILEGMINRD